MIVGYPFLMLGGAAVLLKYQKNRDRKNQKKREKINDISQCYDIYGIFLKYCSTKTINELEDMLDDNTVVKYKNNHQYSTEVVHKLWEQKNKFFKDFEKNMLTELKRDYINEHGIEKYMIEEENIKKEMKGIIFKQQKMLFVWNEWNE